MSVGRLNMHCCLHKPAVAYKKLECQCQLQFQTELLIKRIYKKQCFTANKKYSHSLGAPLGHVSEVRPQVQKLLYG